MWRALRTASHLLAPALVAAAAPALAAARADDDAPLATSYPHGLTSAGCTGGHYSASMDLGAPLLLRGSRDLMAAARADAQARLRLGADGAALSQGEARRLEGEAVQAHLRQAAQACSRFLDSAAVHGREEIRAALGSVLLGKGRLALLQGGKSVGASLLLQELAGQQAALGVGGDGARRVLLYVDARSCSGDLAAGLVAALERVALEQQRRCALALPTATSAPLALAFLGAAASARLSLSGEPSAEDHSLALLAIAAQAARAQGYYLCLILDEASLFFPAPSGQPGAALTPAQLSAQRQLAKLVELTKQSRKMNALLVSSECAYPSRLRSSRFFNATNLTDTLFAGEVPPAAMRQLLVDCWGLGPRLADVLLALYGGHVHMAALALEKLSQQLDEFNCEEVAPSGVLGAIVDCIGGEGRGSSSSSSSSGSGWGPMVATLRALASQGFAPVTSEGNAQAQALSKASVGAVVATSSRVVWACRRACAAAAPATAWCPPRSLLCVSPAARPSAPPSFLALCSSRPTLARAHTSTVTALRPTLASPQRHLVAKALHDCKASA